MPISPNCQGSQHKAFSAQRVAAKKVASQSSWKLSTHHTDGEQAGATLSDSPICELCYTAFKYQSNYHVNDPHMLAPRAPEWDENSGMTEMAKFSFPSNLALLPDRIAGKRGLWGG